MKIFGRILPSLALAACSSVAVAQATTRPAPPRPIAQASGVTPAGATARCRDGSFTTDGSADRCVANGGVLVSFPVREVPPAPARPLSAVLSNRAAAGSSDDPAARRPTSSAPPPAIAAAQPTPTEGAIPPGAAGRCRDGSIVLDGEPAAACKSRGGVAVMAPPSAAIPAKAPRVGAVPALESRELPRPVGATAQCKDGTFATGSTSPATCGGNGGIAVVFPAERKPVPRS